MICVDMVPLQFHGCFVGWAHDGQPSVLGSSVLCPYELAPSDVIAGSFETLYHVLFEVVPCYNVS